LASCLALLQEKYPDLSTQLETGLVAVVKAWPTLPGPTKKAIMAMI